MANQPGEELVAILDGIQIQVRDVKLLTHPKAWIPDSVIGFYLENLRLDFEDNPERDKDDVGIIAPSVVQFIKITESNKELLEMLQPLELPKKKLILVPVNNADPVASSNGTHWSLLVIDTAKKRSIHVDTLDMNSTSAKGIMGKLSVFLDWPSHGIMFKEFRDQRQVGTSVCGQHVMSNARRAIEQFFGSDKDFDLIKDFNQVKNEEIFSG